MKKESTFLKMKNLPKQIIFSGKVFILLFALALSSYVQGQEKAVLYEFNDGTHTGVTVNNAVGAVVDSMLNLDITAVNWNNNLVIDINADIFANPVFEMSYKSTGGTDITAQFPITMVMDGQSATTGDWRIYPDFDITPGVFNTATVDLQPLITSWEAELGTTHGNVQSITMIIGAGPAGDDRNFSNDSLIIDWIKIGEDLVDLNIQATNGTVTTSPQPKLGFVNGSSVTMTAVPDAGYKFAEFTGDLGMKTAENPATFVINDSLNIQANFVSLNTILYDFNDPADAGVTVEGSTGGVVDGELALKITQGSWGGDYIDVPINIDIYNNPVMEMRYRVVGADDAAVCPTILSIDGVFTTDGYPNEWRLYPTLDMSGNYATLTLQLGGMIASWESFNSTTEHGYPETVRFYIGAGGGNAFTSDSIIVDWIRVGDALVDITTVATNGSIAIEPASTMGYVVGSTVTVTATPDAGYSFAGFSTADKQSADNPATFEVTDGMEITAYFVDDAATTYTISVDDYNGSIILDPPGFTYAENTVVTVTAVPDDSYNFSGWTGDLTGTTNPESITMTADVSIGADFMSASAFTLTLSTSLDKATLTSDPAGDIFADGTQVTLTITPDYGFEFAGWSGDLTGTENPVTISIDSNIVIEALIDSIPIYYIETTATNGVIFVSPDPQKDGGYLEGTEVKFNVQPYVGYEFTGWGGDLAEYTTEEVSLTMTKDIIADITFTEIASYTLAVTADANGSVIIEPEKESYILNEDVVIMAVADNGYRFAGWTGDATGMTNPMSLKMDSDMNITATFEAIPAQYTLTTTATNGSIAVDPAPVNGTYDEGTMVTLTATANEGYEFVDWTGDATGTDATVTITVDGDKSVTANFSLTTTGIEQISNTNQSGLLQNYPSPFSVSTTIPYQLNKAAHVKLTIYNSLGQKVAILVDEYQAAGNYEVEWKALDSEGRRLTNGLYLYRLESDDNMDQIRKTIISR